MDMAVDTADIVVIIVASDLLMPNLKPNPPLLLRLMPKLHHGTDMVVMDGRGYGGYGYGGYGGYGLGYGGYYRGKRSAEADAEAAPWYGYGGYGYGRGYGYGGYGGYGYGRGYYWG